MITVKNNKYLIRVCLALVVAVLLFFCIMSTALAQTSIVKISLNQASGIVGSTVVVNGENFPGNQASLYWDGKVLNKDIPISADGKFSANLIVPEAFKGMHIISADDNSNWAGSKAEANFNVLPAISIFPTVTKVLAPILIKGNGFDKNEANIKILVDGKIVPGQAGKADYNGSWSYNYGVQDVKNGRHVVTISGSSTQQSEVSQLDFIVAPWLEVSPSSGPVGTLLKIMGWGFMHNEDGITVTWDNEIIVVNIRAEVDGSLIVDGSKREYGIFLTSNESHESVFVPPTTQGNHKVGVYGSSFTPRGTLPEYTFTVTPQLNIQPATGHKGTQVNIKGTGFAKNEAVELTFDNTSINSEVLADNTGNFSTEYTIPQISGTDHAIGAQGSNGNSGSATFTLDKIEVGAPVLETPNNNTNISAFNSVGDVYLGAIKYLGGIGDYLRGSVVKENDRPIVTFKWLGDTNNTGTTYVLQISTDKNFKTIVLDRNVRNSQYSLTRNDGLPTGSYYWRVKSVDAIGNESLWSDTRLLEITSMSGMVILLSIIVLVLLIAAIIFIIITLYVRATNRYKY